MLTEPDGTEHGGETDRNATKAGFKNKELMDFLNACVRNRKRDIEQIQKFFLKLSIKSDIYEKDKYFSHRRRQDYFEQIGNELLSDSLIFVDPDNGLEVEKKDEKHLLYKEVVDLYERMGRKSILMIFQFFPRENHLEYLHHRCEELNEKVTGDEPICIDDNNIIFFFLTKDKSLEKSLVRIIGVYRDSYSE